MRIAKYLPLIAFLAPACANASSGADLLIEIAGLFNMFVGAMLVISLLLMAGGFVMWAVRLGAFPSYRDEAIDVLEWGVATLFTLVVVLGVVEYVESHVETALSIVGFLVVVLVGWLIITSGIFSGGGEKHE